MDRRHFEVLSVARHKLDLTAQAVLLAATARSLPRMDLSSCQVL